MLQAALLSAALTRKVAAAVSVGTYSTWESTATLRLLGGVRGVWAPTGREERSGGILCRHAHSLFYKERFRHTLPSIVIGATQELVGPVRVPGLQE